MSSQQLIILEVFSFAEIFNSEPQHPFNDGEEEQPKETSQHGDSFTDDDDNIAESLVTPKVILLSQHPPV
jgi:hypothetical protein